MITVRLFAAAAEAAGTSSRQMSADTVAQLVDLLVTEHGASMARVLDRSALLSAGRRLDRDDPLAPGALVDVLPPFAGG